GAFVYSDLSAKRPEAGGQYVYLREAFHPALGFLYGWALLVVIQTGGGAARAVTLARHFPHPSRPRVPQRILPPPALAPLTVINCLGVVAGSRVQSGLMVIKIAALAALIFGGLFLGSASTAPSTTADGALGAALIPVLFSYGGWQTACFVAGEMQDP